MTTFLHVVAPEARVGCLVKTIVTCRARPHIMHLVKQDQLGIVLSVFKLDDRIKNTILFVSDDGQLKFSVWDEFSICNLVVVVDVSNENMV